jgi:Cyclin-dependent kinase inhibitor
MLDRLKKRKRKGTINLGVTTAKIIQFNIIFSTGYRYNFDPVTEQPLPGRYEWEKLDSPK